MENNQELVSMFRKLGFSEDQAINKANSTIKAAEKAKEQKEKNGAKDTIAALFKDFNWETGTVADAMKIATQHKDTIKALNASLLFRSPAKPKTASNGTLSPSMKEKAAEVVVWLKAHPGSSSKAIEEGTGVKLSQALRDGMKAAGMVKTEGSLRSMTYSLA